MFTGISINDPSKSIYLNKKRVARFYLVTETQVVGEQRNAVFTFFLTSPNLSQALLVLDREKDDFYLSCFFKKLCEKKNI